MLVSVSHEDFVPTLCLFSQRLSFLPYHEFVVVVVVIVVHYSLDTLDGRWAHCIALQYGQLDTPPAMSISDLL